MPHPHAAPSSGLTEAEAAERLRREGPNELPQARGRRFARILRDTLSEPMFALLLAAGLIYLLLGDKVEAGLLLVFACLSVAIAVVQEVRSERVIEALRDLSSPRALVVRDGEPRRIAGREVVRGDIIIVGEGERIPADGLLLEAIELSIDESLLTGESAPVRKRSTRADDSTRIIPGGDDLPGVFAGTLVARGRGMAQVTATGPQSEVGRIGQALSTIERTPANLSRQTARMVRGMALIGIVCCLVVVVLYGLLRGSWLDALLAGIALGMSMLPEEFPLVLTVFMVMGAWRISRTRVLTRRAAAIETLGEATVLCTDKTGTLTENRMTVSALDCEGRTLLITGAGDIPEGFRPLARVAALASTVEAFDPMDRAFHVLAHRTGTGPSEFIFVRSYGLRPELLAVTQVWRAATSETLIAAAKGAPEAIARLCRLDERETAALAAKTAALAAQGLRVLAVAQASTQEPLPASPMDMEFRLLGLAGLADPLRPSVPGAVAECHGAGIRVIMITGDHAVTAGAIARQAGLRAELVLEGPALAAMSDEELQHAVESADVFARILPEQKLRIVRSLKAAGEIVAMTGDGVNDAPSLKAADIGIAMGGRGTDVAREAASLVLLDDDFGSIVHTIRLGRRIFDNLRKAMAYIVAVHVPIAGLVLLPLLTGLPLILGPIHIAFLEMVIDPVCSMVFEAEEAEEGIMQRAPRRANSPLFSAALVAWSFIQGLIALAGLAGVYLMALHLGLSGDEARALTFVSLVLIYLGLVLVNRNFGVRPRDLFGRRNRALAWILAVTLSVLTLALAVPAGRALFHFGPLHADDLTVVAAAVIAVVGVVESVKRFWRKRLVR